MRKVTERFGHKLAREIDPTRHPLVISLEGGGLSPSWHWPALWQLSDLIRPTANRVFVIGFNDKSSLWTREQVRTCALIMDPSLLTFQFFSWQGRMAHPLLRGAVWELHMGAAKGQHG